MATLQELVAKVKEEDDNDANAAYLSALYELYTRIMTLPFDALREEVAKATKSFCVDLFICAWIPTGCLCSLA
jgi:hypothetical protein